MDAYDDGYETQRQRQQQQQQQSYPAQYRRVVVDASGRVLASSRGPPSTGADALRTQPQRIVYTSRSQQSDVHDRPRTQVRWKIVALTY